MKSITSLRFALAAALVLALGSLSGCGGDDPPRSDAQADAASGGARADAGSDAMTERDAQTDGGEDAQPGRDAYVIDDRGQLVVPDGEPPLEQPLLLNSIVPNRGVLEGGTRLRLIGTGFREGLRVLFDLETECVDLVIETSNRATCVAPAGAAPGQVDLLAIQPSNDPFADPSDLDRSLLSGGYTYF